MDNYSGVSPYNHSNAARRVVNTMVIARLDNNDSCAIMKIADESTINQNTKTFTLVSTNDLVLTQEKTKEE
jgi:hypothetical protein